MRPIRRIILAAAAATLAGCGGGGGSEPLTLTFSPNQVTVKTADGVGRTVSSTLSGDFGNFAALPANYAEVGSSALTLSRTITTFFRPTSADFTVWPKAGAAPGRYIVRATIYFTDRPNITADLIVDVQ